MSNHAGYYDANNLDAAYGNASNDAWDNGEAWNWPSDLPQQHQRQEEQHHEPSTSRQSHLPTQPNSSLHSNSHSQRQPQAQSQPQSHAHTHAPLHAQPAPTPTPYYHRQLPPLSHTNPIASLTAALRGEDISLPGPQVYQQAPATSSSRQPTSPRHHQPNRESSFGYIPDHFLNSSTDSREPTPQQNRAAVGDLSSQAVQLGGGVGVSVGAGTGAAVQAGASASSTTPPRIDLSADTSPADMPHASGSSSANKRSQATATIDLDDSPKAKRQRRTSNVSAIDLSAVDDDQPSPDQAILDREREELVKKQREESGRAVRLNDLTCMICLEHFTNMSVTHCGHIFCHECLTQALNASERASERNVGTCPACRKPIKRGPTSKNQIIPLALMQKSKPQYDTSSRRPSKISLNPPAEPYG